MLYQSELHPRTLLSAISDYIVLRQLTSAPLIDTSANRGLTAGSRQLKWWG